VQSFKVIPVPGHGAEDVVVATSGPDAGCVYTGTEDGAIFRISADQRRVDRIADTGGRPLGIELYPDGRLLVNPHWIDARALSPLPWVPIPSHDPWGGNTLPIGNRVLLPAHHVPTGEIWRPEEIEKRQREVAFHPALEERVEGAA
jgi:hypothetical protein